MVEVSVDGTPLTLVEDSWSSDAGDLDDGDEIRVWSDPEGVEVRTSTSRPTGDLALAVRDAARDAVMVEQLHRGAGKQAIQHALAGLNTRLAVVPDGDPLVTDSTLPPGLRTDLDECSVRATHDGTTALVVTHPRTLRVAVRLSADPGAGPQL